MGSDEWLSQRQIANELGVSPRTVEAWRCKGEGPIGYRIGKHVRVKRSDLNKWLDGRVDSARSAA